MDQPMPGKIYALTGSSDQPAISNGNTWKESEIRFPNDQHLVGKILVDMWGYSMTIVDYYKIVKETSSTVWVQEIAAKEEADGFLTGESTPLNPTLYGDKVFRVKKPKAAGEYFRSSLDKHSIHLLELWDGKPKRFNHCD